MQGGLLEMEQLAPSSCQESGAAAIHFPTFSISHAGDRQGRAENPGGQIVYRVHDNL